MGGDEIVGGYTTAPISSVTPRAARLIVPGDGIGRSAASPLLYSFTPKIPLHVTDVNAHSLPHSVLSAFLFPLLLIHFGLGIYLVIVVYSPFVLVCCVVCCCMGSGARTVGLNLGPTVLFFIHFSVFLRIFFFLFNTCVWWFSFLRTSGKRAGCGGFLYNAVDSWERLRTGQDGGRGGSYWSILSILYIYTLYPPNVLVESSYTRLLVVLFAGFVRVAGLA